MTVAVRSVQASRTVTRPSPAPHLNEMHPNDFGTEVENMRIPVRATWSVVLAICTTAAAWAAPVDADLAGRMARRWAERDGAAVVSVTPLDPADPAAGWLAALAPQGWVLIAGRTELAPVKAAGDGEPPRSDDAGGVLAVARDDLAARLPALADAAPHPAWERWTAAPIPDTTVEIGPLLATSWRQDWPFNSACPSGDGGLSFPGCTALAVAQIMAHHQWPPRGLGSHAYWWDGDQACGGGTAGAWLEADFTDDFAWGSMPDAVSWSAPDSVNAAVGELCYEVAVALEMDFSACGSGASVSRIPSALSQRFRYAAGAYETSRFRKTDAMWSDLLRAEVEGGRPAVYASMIHAMVLDGWREVDGVVQIHLNYGWNGDSNGWYTLDAVATSLNPDTEKAVLGILPDLTTPLEPGVPQAPAALATDLGAPWPNPANPSVSVRLELATPGPVRAAVWDVRGRRVASLHDGPLPAGAHVLRWDGRTDAGRHAPDGLYLLRVDGAGAPLVRRFSLAR